MAEYVMEYDGWAEGIPVGEYLKVRDAMHARKREEVVRCRDCEYRRRSLNGHEPNFIGDWFCSYTGGHEVKPDGFCYRGERRADG